MSRRGKSRETESRLMVSRSLGQARGRRDGYWTGVWEGTENLLAPARRDTCTTLGVSWKSLSCILQNGEFYTAWITSPGNLFKKSSGGHKVARVGHDLVTKPPPDLRFIPVDRPTSPREPALPPCFYWDDKLGPHEAGASEFCKAPDQLPKSTAFDVEAESSEQPLPWPGPCSEQAPSPAGSSSYSPKHQGTNSRKRAPVFCTSFLCLYLAINLNPSNKRYYKTVCTTISFCHFSHIQRASK